MAPSWVAAVVPTSKPPWSLGRRNEAREGGAVGEAAGSKEEHVGVGGCGRGARLGDTPGRWGVCSHLFHFAILS